MAIEVNSSDSSYMPQRVTVQGGSVPDNVQDISTVRNNPHLHQPFRECGCLETSSVYICSHILPSLLLVLFPSFLLFLFLSPPPPLCSLPLFSLLSSPLLSALFTSSLFSPLYLSPPLLPPAGLHPLDIHW